MTNTAIAAATSQMALMGSPRRRATTPRHHAPTMAMAAHRILPAGLGLTTTVDMRVGSWTVPRQGRPGDSGGQCHYAPANISHWSNAGRSSVHLGDMPGAYTGAPGSGPQVDAKSMNKRGFS